MNVIVPACGLSTRFPNRPLKWLLTDPSGDLMIQKAIKGIESSIAYDKLYFVVNKLICSDYSMETLREIMSVYRNVELVVLDYQTKSQTETVFKAIKKCDLHGPIYIKDTDNYFEAECSGENTVSVCCLDDYDVSYRGKSYVEVDHDGAIKNIVEKRVISNLFCCGGYGFKCASEFVKYYNPDLAYISDLIRVMINDGQKIYINRAKNYIDWGDLESWEKYRSEYRTIFIDLDGVIVVNSGRYSKQPWGRTMGIRGNIDFLNELYTGGKTQIVIVTARPEEFRKVTEAQLKREGVMYHMLVMGMLHAKRILVNDYSVTNPYRSCEAINVRRNGYIKDQLVGGL